MPYDKTSPSQITTFQLCERRWHFGSIKKLPQPQSPDAAKGEAMHKEMERWSLDGVMPTHPSCIEATTLEEVQAPTNHESILIEGKTTKPAFYLGTRKVLLNGRIDRVDARDLSNPLILDWKSKGKTLYALSRPKLAVDIQLNTYAAWLLTLMPDAEGVWLAHGYLGREEEYPYAKIVKTKEPVKRADVFKLMKTLDPIVDRMAELAEVDDTLSLPLPPADASGRRQACHAYGMQCPFYSSCIGKEAEMPLLDKMQSQAGADKIPAPSPSTSVTPGPKSGATTGTGTTLYVYIDTIPEKGVDSVVRLDDEIARRTEEIIKAHGAKTLFDPPLNFGKGRDLLVESFRKNPPTGVVLATSAGLYSAQIIEVLTPQAAAVWRGF